MTVLIVGLGSIAQKHIDALRQIERDCTIYALRSSEEAACFDGIVNLYSFDEINKITFSFAIISNPTSEHKSTIKNLIHLNCPLFIEKPLYNSLDISELILEIKQKSILTYVACNLRFLDSLVYVKAHIGNKSKRINEVNAYCGSYLPDWRSGDYKRCYSAIPELGGGVHLDLIHELDYLYWFFGMPVDTWSILRNASSLDIRSCDYANYCLKYEKFCASVVLNYYRQDYKRTCEIVFEDETWLVDLKENNIRCGSKIIFESSQTIKETYIAQMAYFLDILKSKGHSFNMIDDAYNVLQIALYNDSQR